MHIVATIITGITALMFYGACVKAKDERTAFGSLILGLAQTAACIITAMY